MGIFTRFRDIISSNLNCILDRAEDPEKMVRLMILEMEDTLVEIKSACAGVMADQKKTERHLADAKAQETDWEAKAALAVSKSRDDLARAALVEKRKYAQRIEALTLESARLKDAVASFQDDITQLESKLNDAREKQRAIIARHAAAQAKNQTHSAIRRADTSEAFMKFEAFENRIERMEAGAVLRDSLRPKDSLRDQFAKLEGSDDIERELERLKGKTATA